MASQQQIYETRILLNSEQATKEITKLEKKVEELKRKRQDALEAGDTKSWAKLNKEVDKYEKKLDSTRGRLDSINKTLNNMSTAGPKQLKDTIRDINNLLSSGAIERGSIQWKALTASLKEAKTELKEIEGETKAATSAWGKFTKFLNDSWGGLTMLIGTVAGISMTVRKTVQDYAKMEEAMADTRKYTGLADAAIRELNEDLKKMDTRTSREELNQLAGTAGRLGITSKADILEFVDAANQIKVALGDDLGEGAIDNVGKLAMAFGEDERMGLRGAMLATGSAVNELAQNSSAKAGYLVDFTARVAGFGKQLGLTQAQIMGFGAVMDENLLRDEMAATAFGNMLTKMQTDTEKFARIAGMDVKAFTDLLNRDANAAILALADNMKKVDPQSMMKMLDDMGLDGARAVGVLSTMVDKIDDVRERQQLATKAYQEATSVGNEYRVMNNTVEASIDKCKKQFQEMAVELGEKLVPIVKYTISSTSLIVKGLSAILDFGYQNIGMITKLAVVLAEYVAIKKLHYLWTQRTVVISKAQLALDTLDRTLTSVRITLLKALVVARMANNGAITKTIALQRILNLVFAKNPIGAVVTVVAALTLGLWKLVDAIQGANKEKRLMNEIYDTAAEKIAEEKSELNRLLRVARDENAQLDKRKEAIEKLNSIIPGYNGQLDKTTGKYTENATALAAYNSLLREKYRLEAAEDKMKELEKERFRKELEYEKKLQESYDREEANKHSAPLLNQGNGPFKQSQQYSEENFRKHLELQYKKENAELEKQIGIVTGIRDRSKEMLDFANQFNATMENARIKLEGGNDKKKQPENVTPYISNAERKKQEAEQRKREAEERKAEAERLRKMREADKEAKAIMDNRLAENLLNYQAGLQDYRQFMANQEKIQREGLQARRDAWDEDTAEYAKYQKQLAALQLNGDQERTRQTVAAIDRDHKIMREWLKSRFDDQNSEYYQNEVVLNEALYKQDIEFLRKKAKRYREGSLERMQIEWEIQDREDLHQLEQQRTFQQMVDNLKTTYLQQGNAKREQMELNALEELNKKKLLTEEEYQRAKLAIQAQYSQAQTPDEKTAAAGADMLKVAQTSAAKDAGTGTSTPIYGTISMYVATMDKLKELYGQDEKNHEAYLAAKQQATAQFCQQLASEFQAAYQTIGNLMSAASSYYGAQSDYEVAMTKKKYEKQIEAAGNNQKKVKKLQEQQAKEEAAIKTKYNNRQVKIQIAQALAQTATNALNAYGSVVGIPVVGPTLAPIAAAMAVAAGMLQVATIKKQAEAQQAGYYEGGFTGGKRYRKEAGIVHEGEFVANHQAVNNPNVLPFLNFLDQAQRNNTVGSLTAQDVSRSMGSVGSNQVVAPVVNVNVDNDRLNSALERVNENQDRLATQLEQGIGVDVPIDGENGLYRRLKKYEKLINKK